MHPNAQATEWNILLSKYHIYLNTLYTKLNTSKLAKNKALQKLYETMHMMISELDPCVASVYAAIPVSSPSLCTFLPLYYKYFRLLTKTNDMLDKNSLGLLKKGAAKESRIKSIT